MAASISQTGNPINMYFTLDCRSSRGIYVNNGTACLMSYNNGDQIPYSDNDDKRTIIICQTNILFK